MTKSPRLAYDRKNLIRQMCPDFTEKEVSWVDDVISRFGVPIDEIDWDLDFRQALPPPDGWEAKPNGP